MNNNRPPPQHRRRKRNSENTSSQSQKNFKDGQIWFDPSCLPPRTPTAVSRLTENIVNYDNHVGINAQVEESISKVIQDLEAIVLKELSEFGDSSMRGGSSYRNVCDISDQPTASGDKQITDNIDMRCKPAKS